MRSSELGIVKIHYNLISNYNLLGRQNGQDNVHVLIKTSKNVSFILQKAEPIRELVILCDTALAN